MRSISSARLSKYAKYILFTLRYFTKYYGLHKALKQLLIYHYGLLKQLQIDYAEEQVIEVNGYKLHLVPNDKGISTELLMFGSHEPLTTQLLLEELKDGMVCIDIGSNIGYYALLESRLVGDRGKVIAIEPLPKNFRYLQTNIDLQRSYNIEAKNFAIGDIDGEIEFLISDRSNWGRVGTQTHLGFDNIEEIIRVPIRRLDTVLEENPLERVDIIRMDVEGYETNVYNGMKNVVRWYKPMLLIEVHKIYLGVGDTIKFLLQLKNDGYEIKYYIPREMDMPLIGNTRDIHTFRIEELIKRLSEDSVPDNFHLFLYNKA